MNTLTIHFVLAGLCFGAWPLFMNKSGLSGNLSSFTLTAIIIIFTFPFVFSEFKNITNANWVMVLGASIFATAGMILFNKGLFKATQQEVSSLFVTMVVIQIIVPVVYKIIINGVTIKQIFGFILAGVVAVLLN